MIRSDGNADLFPNISIELSSNNGGCYGNLVTAKRVEVDYRLSWTSDWQWALLWPLDSAVNDSQCRIIRLSVLQLVIL
jgi:hypothetical protein